jgi:hypothetical protein
MARAAKKAGGQTEGEKDFGKPRGGVPGAEASPPPESRTNNPKIKAEAEEKKKGGRAKRKHGGIAKHFEKGEDMKHAKHIGEVHGKAKVHAGREPRKSGGSNFSPLSSAHSGSPPRDHKVTEID